MLIVIEFFVKDQSGLESPRGLVAPICHWSVEKKCGTCFLSSIVCLLPCLPTPSILKAKIEDSGYNVVAFCAGARLDRGA